MAMEGTPFYSLAELVQEIALQQAAERTQSGTTEANLATIDTDTSRTSAIPTVKEETDEILASYLDEKAKNDALSRQLELVSTCSTICSLSKAGD